MQNATDDAIEHLWRRALMHRQNGNAAQATSLLLQIVEQRPSPTAFSALAELFREAGETANAYRCYKLALDMDETHPESLRGLAALHTEQGRHQDAVYVYACLVKHYPNETEARINLGAALARIGNDEEAEACFFHALRAGPDSPLTGVALFNLARVYAGMGHLDASLDALLAASVKDPEHGVRACLDDAFAELWAHPRLSKVIVLAERAILLRFRQYVDGGRLDELKRNLVNYPCLQRVVRERPAFSRFRTALPS